MKTEDIAVAHRVLEQAEDAVRRKDLAVRETKDALAEVARLKDALRAGSLYVGQRTWSGAEVEELRSNWATRGLLLEEVADALDFLAEELPSLRPTARRAIETTRAKIKKEVDR